jgi:ethanolamine utilization protein EutQ
MSDLKVTPAKSVRFEYGEMAMVTEVSGAGDGSALGGGFGRFTNAQIPWTVKYDEILLVLEGQLTVRTADGDLVAGPHDTIWLPNGTELTYISESALVFYAIQPTTWAEG